MNDFASPEAEREYRASVERERRRRQKPRPHNHEEQSKILRQLNIGAVERLFLWLAKTDYYVLALSTYQSRIILSGMGMMVVFTSLMALCTSAYTISSTMITAGEGLARWLPTVALSLLYAFGIMIIDREIVGSSGNAGKWRNMVSGIVRIVFAIGIATTVSFPVELKLFEGRINTEIQKMEDETNREMESRIAAIRAPYLAASESTLDSIRSSIDSYNREIATLTGEIAREASNVQCAERCQSFRRQKEQAQRAVQAEQQRLNSVLTTVQLPQAAQGEVEDLQSRMQANRGHVDLMTKWEALERLKAAPDSNFAVLAWFILGFFMLLELVPLSLKATLGKTEYHYYLESRALLNNQKIVGVTNEYLRRMQEDPAIIETMPRELTDIIARLIEDEATAVDEESYDLYSSPANAARAAGPQPADPPPPGFEDPEGPTRAERA
jgi:hypothetical protein